MIENFDDMFKQATGRPPFPYQQALATADVLATLLDAPTGAGKTAAVFLAWLWRRRFASAAVRAATPRRLIWCLPTCAMPEHTAAVMSVWRSRAGLQEIGVHTLLGGAVAQGFEAQTDVDQVIVGTQDLLLSQALNRGYALALALWPLACRLLNTDCLWVCDDVNLMGVGLSTAVQLDEFRRTLPASNPHHTLYLGANLDPSRLPTVDGQRLPRRVVRYTAADFAHPELARRWQAPKTLEPAHFAAHDWVRLAAEVRAAHTSGTITMVVLSQVQRAQALFAELVRTRPQAPGDTGQATARDTAYDTIHDTAQDSAQDTAVHLLHSEFRPAERRNAVGMVTSPGADGILVATQAIDSGIERPARALFTELAPYDALVQRFGLCNLRGGTTNDFVRWIDLIDADAAPYDPHVLASARHRLLNLSDVGPLNLPAAEPMGVAQPVIEMESIRALHHSVPTRSSTDLDISAYVSSADSAVVFVAWRHLPEPAEHLPADTPAVQRAEICRVSVSRFRLHLDRLTQSDRTVLVWHFSPTSGVFEQTDLQSLAPGMTLLLDLSMGGYSTMLGYTGDPDDRPDPVPATSFFNTSY